MLKVTAILSIVFGFIGIFFGIWLIQTGLSDPRFTSGSLFGVIVFIVWVLPHVFWIISGFQLLQSPKKSLTQGLLVTTIVLGALWNVLLMAFAIVNLVQLSQQNQSK